MRAELIKGWDLEAAHYLCVGSPDSPNRRIHGHTWRVVVCVEGEVNELTGMVVSFAELDDAWSGMHDTLDHRLLNEVDGLQPPTSEVVAGWALARFREKVGPSVKYVEVWKAGDGVRVCHTR